MDQSAMAKRPLSPPAMRWIGPKFFRQSAVDVAQQLLGAILVRRMGGIERRARIVETEAYLGPADRASHASKGRTRRTEVMFGPAGHAYVYFIYGMHYMLNVVTGTTGKAHAVLLRGAAPLDGWDVDLSGPGRLARAFEISRADNGRPVTGPDLQFARDRRRRPEWIATPRIGVDYAGEWRHALLRFIDVEALPSRRRAARRPGEPGVRTRCP